MAKSKDRRKLKGISYWGPIVGFVGGIVGLIGGILVAVSTGLSLFDRFIPSNVEVLSLMPIRVDSTRQWPNPNIAYPYWGVSFIVHLENKEKTVLISGIDISGKVYLRPSEYLGQNPEGRTSDEIEKERVARRPYRIISWAAWLTDSRIPIRLEPYEERYIKFTLFEPKPAGGYSGNDEYIGYENESKPPQLIYSHEPYIYWIFGVHLDKNRNMFVPRKIRDEILNADVTFKLRIDSRSVNIAPDKFKPWTAAHIRRWKNTPGQQLYNELLDSRSSSKYEK